MNEEELKKYCQEENIPLKLAKDVKKTKKLPVVNFAEEVLQHQLMHH